MRIQCGCRLAIHRWRWKRDCCSLTVVWSLLRHQNEGKGPKHRESGIPESYSHVCQNGSTTRCGFKKQNYQGTMNKDLDETHFNQFTGDLPCACSWGSTHMNIIELTVSLREWVTIIQVIIDAEVQGSEGPWKRMTAIRNASRGRGCWLRVALKDRTVEIVGMGERG